MGEEILFFADDIAFPVLDEPILDEFLNELLLGDGSFAHKPVNVDVLAALPLRWHADVAAESWLFVGEGERIDVDKLMVEMLASNSDICCGIIS